MALTIGTLASGQLPNVKGTLYTVPAGTVAHVWMSVTNSSGSTRTHNIYIKRSGGSSVLVSALNKSQATGADPVYYPLAGNDLNGFKLSAGDIVEGDASAATAVDYLIFGGTEPIP